MAEKTPERKSDAAGGPQKRPRSRNPTAFFSFKSGFHVAKHRTQYQPSTGRKPANTAHAQVNNDS